MQVELTNSQRASVSIRYDKIERPTMAFPMVCDVIRTTEVSIHVYNKNGANTGHISGLARCMPQDQFCRKVGRQIALRNLCRINLNNINSKRIISKEDMSILAPVILHGAQKNV